MTNRLTQLCALATLVVASAATGCDRAPAGAPAPTPKTIAGAGPLAPDRIRALARRAPEQACELVAAHAARTIEDYFGGLAASLSDEDRATWLDDIHARFSEASLIERCEARAQQAAFVDATTCVAAATSMMRIMACNLWQPGAA